MKSIIAAMTVAILATGCASPTPHSDVLVSYKGVKYERAVAAQDLDTCRAELQPGLNFQPEKTPAEITNDSVVRANRAERATRENERNKMRLCMAAKGHIELVVVQ